MGRDRLVYYNPPSRTERRGGDRRVGGEPYTGAERRRIDRRAEKQGDRPNLLIVLVALVATLVIVDAFLWHSHYRCYAMFELGQTAAEIRAWSDGIWRY